MASFKQLLSGNGPGWFNRLLLGSGGLNVVLLIGIVMLRKLCGATFAQIGAVALGTVIGSSIVFVVGSIMALRMPE